MTYQYSDSLQIQIKKVSVQSTSMMVLNIPQTKSVSIAFCSLKKNIFCTIAVISAIQISEAANENLKCSQDQIKYFKLLRVLVSLSTIFDILILFYFFFSKQFKKAVFFVFVIFHWIISLTCLIGGAQKLIKEQSSDLFRTLVITVIGSSVIFPVNSIIAMAGDVYYVLKFLHFGSNLAWLMICYTIIRTSYVHFEVLLVGFIHGMLSVTNTFFLVGTKISSQGLEYFRTWRFLAVISVFMMIICYLIVLVALQHVHHNLSLKFFIFVYMKYGLLEIISPLLVLIFMRGQTRDPRILRVKERRVQLRQIGQNKILEFSRKI